MTSIKNKNIAIIGGGPGGLTLARLLQMRGLNIKVYERDVHRTVRVQGATLDLHYESGLKALNATGLMGEFEKHYRPGADLMTITDKHAKPLLRDTESREGADARPEIDRGPLRDILIDSLEPGTIVWNKRFQSMQRNENKWLIAFNDEYATEADIVIGADGANSKIRPYLTTLKAFFVDITVIEGAVYNAIEKAPRIMKLLNGGKIFTLGDSCTLIVSSKGDGSIAFYVGFKSEEDWAVTSGIDFTKPQEVANWFKTKFAGWSDIWLELFENAESPIIPRPQYCMPLDQDWQAQADLTIIGDAAHLMPPYAGEGVNMAMLDALELAEALTGPLFNDSLAAIANYETSMRKRAAETAAVTLQQTELMHSPNGLEEMLAFFKS
ncbi:FAD-dependent monooxygenase [Mucilaginibacter achroorhodeus]|uniref:Flavin-dependent monooxygenase n=1 Tax=Mucilaginibacter achroorhodeus TaxID=2599294 RepID=A0A563U757_9SPHI|nr:NAD(P)/FAD-dependent oxidoreductase [Mucilaginibacter achroorhodeus]TWR27180.1 FAD-dependent monooxygenase [Mucilaginibacter achroorhodeus]